MITSGLTLAAIVEASCFVCGVTVDGLFAKRPGRGDHDAARSRTLAAVVAVRAGFPRLVIEQAFDFSGPMVSQLVSRFEDRVARGDAAIERSARTVESQAREIMLSGGSTVVLPGRVIPRPGKPPRAAPMKPGPKLGSKQKIRPPKERVISPTDLLPAHEVAEAQRLRRAGWSFKGLTRRFELGEREMRIVIGEPVL